MRRRWMRCQRARRRYVRCQRVRRQRVRCQRVRCQRVRRRCVGHRCVGHRCMGNRRVTDGRVTDGRVTDRRRSHRYMSHRWRCRLPISGRRGRLFRRRDRSRSPHPRQWLGNRDHRKVAKHFVLHGDHGRLHRRRNLRCRGRLRHVDSLRLGLRPALGFWVVHHGMRLRMRMPLGARRLRDRRGARHRRGTGACGRHVQRLLVVRMQCDRKPLLRGIMVDPSPRRHDAVPDADRQFLDRPKDGFLAGSDLDPIHEEQPPGAPGEAKIPAKFMLGCTASFCIHGPPMHGQSPDRVIPSETLWSERVNRPRSGLCRGRWSPPRVAAHTIAPDHRGRGPRRLS